jgi:LPXTG-motif cell wall-anchored protein
MKGKYFAAAGLAIMGFALYYFLRKRKTEQATAPQKENERHHLTNAFAKAKQVAVDR